MKPSKIAKQDSELARTSKEAMAPKHVDDEQSEEDKIRKGEWDLEDLMKAEAIKGDQGRMEYVHKAHAKKSAAMRSIADLKMAGQALAQQKSDQIKAKAAQPRHKNRFPAREK